MSDAHTSLEVYKLLVEEAREARRARRELSNIFLTLNLAGVGGLGLLAREQSDLNPALFAWCALALVLTCIVWRTSNAYYNKALKTKYVIISRYEQDLGHAPLTEEYQAMGGAKIMRAFTLERAMPYLFVLGYLVFFVVQAGDVDAIAAAVTDLLRRIGVN
ncbi:MAG: hypothetical protein A4S17_06300 [Proteobacteria bacterium HN_bin10]|jgi:hypothetical protein|nr:MAG: hypothetical protein A4S17_06300 [Proteobacteria bacterium HN_bin10]